MPRLFKMTSKWVNTNIVSDSTQFYYLSPQVGTTSMAEDCLTNYEKYGLKLITFYIFSPNLLLKYSTF